MSYPIFFRFYIYVRIIIRIKRVIICFYYGGTVPLTRAGQVQATDGKEDLASQVYVYFMLKFISEHLPNFQSKIFLQFRKIQWKYRWYALQCRCYT